MTGPVGPRGLAVLVMVGLVGVALAVIGWSQRGTGLVAPAVGGLGGSAPARTPTASPATPTARASATSSGSPTPEATPSATASTGPLLSSEPYASFAYLVWPGTPSAAASQAMSGLTVQVSPQAGGISVRAGVAGQPLPSAQFYSGGGKVYVIESNLGDDGGDVDYNLGDDGLVVTNLRGQIVS